MTIGEKIQFRRIQMGMSRQDLADSLMTTPKQVSRYEKGENDPTGNVLLRIAQILEVSSDWLLGLTEDMRPISSDSMLDADEIELLRVYRAKTPDKQESILKMARAV